jgi:hypothetical protein
MGTHRYSREIKLRKPGYVTTFSVATNEYVGNGKEKAEFHVSVKV